MRNWQTYFDVNRDEGLGSSYERIVLNRKLDAVRQQFAVETVLEAPSFGFTGLSGINCVGLARKGVEVSLLDHDRERAKRVRNVWAELGMCANIALVDDYSDLPFPSQAFDMSWNFAAMWFVDDLDQFLSELARVTSKVIVIGVPNRSGTGYWLEKLSAGVDVASAVHEQHIIPRHIARSMERVGWCLTEYSFFDAPPWPDIGMKKQDFLGILGLGSLVRQQDTTRPSLSIVDHYAGRAPAFEHDMLKYYWCERIAPRPLKRFWAHHRILRFEPQ
jgi:SAM-dependent methyltransferase